MIIKKLRTPASPIPHDYESYEQMVSGLNSLFPLTDNIAVYGQGGFIWGQDDFNNSPIGPVDGDWGGFYISITTDPTEITNTSKFLGSIRTNTGQKNGLLRIYDVATYGTFSAPRPYHVHSDISNPSGLIIFKAPRNAYFKLFNSSFTATRSA